MIPPLFYYMELLRILEENKIGGTNLNAAKRWSAFTVQIIAIRFLDFPPRSWPREFLSNAEKNADRPVVDVPPSQKCVASFFLKK